MKREQAGGALAVLAGILGIVTIVTRPFLFGMTATLVLLVATKMTANRRLTGTAAGIVGIGALAGAAIAAGFNQPLY